MKLIYSMLLICGFVVIIQAQQTFTADNKKIFVRGCVKNPSVVAYVETTTLMQVIKEVGGILGNGKKNKIALYRRVSPQSTDRNVIYIDINAIEKGKAEDIKLQRYDVIEIESRNKNKRCNTSLLHDILLY